MITHDRKIDRRIIQEARTLSDNGFEVSIVAFPWEGIDTYDSIKIIRHSITSETNKFDVLRKVYSYFRRFLFSHPKLMFFVRNLSIGWFIDVEKYFESQLLHLAVQEKADIYHGHDLPSLTSAAKAADVNEAKVVYDSHEMYCEQGFGFWEKRKWQDLEKKYIKKADAVIAVNDSIARHFHNKYNVEATVIMNKLNGCSKSDEKNLRVIHDKLEIVYECKTILYQGGIVGGRNLDNLIYAMQYVKSKARLVFLGDGDYKDKLVSIVKRLKLNHSIFFIDEVSQDELLSYTCAADIGVIPYIGDCLNNYYCTPNKLFEFISAELPIIASDLPELEKIVQEEKFGAVVDFTNPQKVADKLDMVLSDNELLAQYRMNISNKKYKYSWDYEEKKLLELYDTLLKK